MQHGYSHGLENRRAGHVVRPLVRPLAARGSLLQGRPLAEQVTGLEPVATRSRRSRFQPGRVLEVAKNPESRYIAGRSLRWLAPDGLLASSLCLHRSLATAGRATLRTV